MNQRLSFATPLFATEQRRTARYYALTEIGRVISSSLSLDAILRSVIEAAVGFLYYDNVALLLIDPDEPTTLVLRARNGLYVSLVSNEYRQSIEQGIIGFAARTRQPVHISDVRSDPRYVPIPASGIVSELAIPIAADDELLGVLNIESAQPIPQEDIDDFQIIAGQLGVALRNARHFEEQQRRAQRLALIARVSQRIVARLDPVELYEITAQELHERLGYDHVALFLLDTEAPGWLVQHACASRWPGSILFGYRQSIERGVVGACARQRTPILVNNVREDGRFIPMSEDTRDSVQAELSVPILLGSRLLGVLDIAGRKPFQEEDATALQIVADQLAIAMDHTSIFTSTQRILDETRLLYETSQRISLALDVPDVVRVYLEQVASGGRYSCTIVLYEYNDAGERSSVLIIGRWGPQEGLTCPLDLRLPYTYDALDPVLDVGHMVKISDVHSDPRVSEMLRTLQKRSGRPALAMLPLMVRGQRTGLVILSHTSIHDWQDDELRLYQITAVQLANAIDSRRQFGVVNQRNQQLAVVEERRRLARELHDSVTQHIFSTTLIAQSIGPAWRRNPSEGEQRVQRLLELSQAALAEMRALLVELQPSEQTAAASGVGTVGQQQLGLVAALQQHVTGLRLDGLNVYLEANRYKPLASETEQHLFRIAQEALNNVVKHAQAKQAWVTVQTSDDATILTIRDDGTGFAPKPRRRRTKLSRQGGMGVETMSERSKAIGGAFTIESTPGTGTTVRVIIG